MLLLALVVGGVVERQSRGGEEVRDDLVRVLLEESFLERIEVVGRAVEGDLGKGEK